MNEIRYDELKAGDVIVFHGAKERIVEVRDDGESEYHKGERVIRFDLEPYDDEAVQILGKFYSHGTYGGVGFLTAPVYKRANENWNKEEALFFAKTNGNEAAYNLLLLGGPDFYDGDYNEYTELLARLESK